MAFGKLKQWRDSIKNTVLKLTENVLDKLSSATKSISDPERRGSLESTGFEKAAGKLSNTLSEFKDNVMENRLNATCMIQAIPVLKRTEIALDRFGQTRDFEKITGVIGEINGEIDNIKERQRRLNLALEEIEKSGVQGNKWIAVKNDETNSLDVFCPEIINKNALEGSRKEAGCFSISYDTGNILAGYTVRDIVMQSAEHSDAVKRFAKKNKGFAFDSYFDHIAENTENRVAMDEEIDNIQHTLDEKTMEKWEEIDKVSAFGLEQFDSFDNHKDFLSAKQLTEKGIVSGLGKSITFKDTLLPSCGLVLNYDGIGNLSNIVYNNGNGSRTVCYDSKSEKFEMLEGMAFRRLVTSAEVGKLLSANLRDEIEAAKDGPARPVEEPRKESVYVRYNALSKNEPKSDYINRVSDPFDKKVHRKMFKIEKQFDKAYPEADISYNPFNNSINLDYEGSHLTFLYDTQGKLAEVMHREKNERADKCQTVYKERVINERFENSEFIKGVLKKCPAGNLVSEARFEKFAEKMKSINEHDR